MIYMPNINSTRNEHENQIFSVQEIQQRLYFCTEMKSNAHFMY